MAGGAKVAIRSSPSFRGSCGPDHHTALFGTSIAAPRALHYAESPTTPNHLTANAFLVPCRSSHSA
jgi:hypothetical protein